MHQPHSITDDATTINADQLTHIELLGVRIHVLPLDTFLDHIIQSVTGRRKQLIAHVNVHGLNLAYEEQNMRTFYNEYADIVFCDGYGVRLGAMLDNTSPPYRYTPIDWMPALSELCEQHDFTIFLLGAQPAVIDAAAERLQGYAPNLRIVGTHHGYFDKMSDSMENQDVLQHINAVRPDILIVGFGMPTQEHWLMDNWEALNVGVALTVGGVFDLLAGTLSRPPRWMTDHGLEWLGRLFIEPRRLWKRYLIGNPLFIVRVLHNRLTS